MNENAAAERKQWKQRAREVVKKHYILLVLLCLVSVFYGGEFGYVTSHTNDTYNLLSGQDPEGTGIMIRIDGKSILELAGEAVGIDLQAITKKHVERGEKIQESGSQKLAKVQSKERGIFSSVANYFSSGGLANSIYQAGSSVFRSKKVVTSLLVVASLLITIFIWVFLKNVYIAVLRRMFLEARIYEHVPASHVLHFRIFGRWKKASLSMLRVSVYEILWWLTVVGGAIKHYSYLCVPYIIAENPDVDSKEAILLSRRMMDGHKLEAFILDVTFIGWHLLGALTFGIVEALWGVPYKTSTFTEYYAHLRALAKENGLEGSEYMNDTYLFEKADTEALKDEYIESEVQELYIQMHAVELRPVQKFFAKNFGLWLGSTANKKDYDDIESRRQQIIGDAATVRGELYPHRLNPLWKEDSYRVIKSARSLRTYTIWVVILLFFIFSFIGWGWEVGIHLVKDGIFVNRGVMHGPWLPVYGSGVAMIVLVLARWRRNPAAEALLTIVLCGFVEYMTSYYLEVTKGMRWWDYTGYFLNINGRICGEGLMVFAIGGMAAVYLLVPIIDSTLSHAQPKALVALSIALVIAFTADMIYSHKKPNIGEGITDYDAYKQTSQIEYDAYEPESQGAWSMRL